jgi:hypothetical protein
MPPSVASALPLVLINLLVCDPPIVSLLLPWTLAGDLAMLTSRNVAGLPAIGTSIQGLDGSTLLQAAFRFESLIELLRGRPTFYAHYNLYLPLSLLATLLWGAF